jgi:hypothetical protein
VQANRVHARATARYAKRWAVWRYYRYTILDTL